MKILLIVAAAGGIALVLWAVYAVIEKINQVGEDPFQYPPLNGWTVGATVLCLLIAGGGVAISRQHGEIENAVIGCGLALFGYISMLGWIARKTSLALAIASAGLLLLLAALSAGIIMIMAGWAWMHLTDDDDARLRRALRK